MSITNPEIKKLYGKAAGRCSICKIDIFKNNVHIGEMAHIIAKSQNGPRGNLVVEGNINSYNNLILLCANHHSEVDQNPSVYTVERIHAIKSEHEIYISSIFEKPRERKNDTSFLQYFMDYVPFTRLQYYVDNLPISVKLDLCVIGDMFEALCMDNPHLYPLNDQSLQQYFDQFLRSYYNLWNVISGYTMVCGLSQANFSQADERFNLRMESLYLPHEAITKLNHELDGLKIEFISSHLKLIEFLRANYKDVNLNSYVPAYI